MVESQIGAFVFEPCENGKPSVTASLSAQQVFFWAVFGSGVRVDFRFSL